MLSVTRTLPRASRSVQVSARLRQVRFQSTTSSSSSSNANASPFAAGIAGGLVAGGLLYGMYYVSPAGKMSRKVKETYNQASKLYDEAAEKIQKNTPNADQTASVLKQYCYSYAAWIPGGRQYVDTAFKDFDTIRENHREEADQLLNDAYKQLQEVSKKGLTLEAVTKGYEVLADLTKKAAELGGDAFMDVLDNHPKVKKELGGSIDQLKEMSDKYGPEAKKQVDETWKQAKEIVQGGFSVENISKAKRLLDEKVEQVKKLGDEAWKKGLEQAKPLLDKNPKVKELIEKNGDILKRGNAKEVFEKVKEATQSGDLGNLEEYVNKAVDQAKSKGSVSSNLGLDQYFDALPNGSEILQKVKQLKDVADKHSEEGKKLLKETTDEMMQVLEKKGKKAEEIANKAKNDAKS